MRLAVQMYYLKNGKMTLISNHEESYDVLSMVIPIRKWYKNNPYAKRISKEWICQDYRIDQQRPQRNVYSEAYIKIISITDMEESHLSMLIEKLESEIDYPTVWDDGKNKYYEETIYCPNCGKRRKVLTSKTHCEFCGFEFDKALKCPKCNALNMKGSKFCIKCGYKFRKEPFINNNDFEVIKNKNVEKIKCPICGEKKSKYFNKCQNCGFDYENKKKCVKCGEWVDEDDEVCCFCGQKLSVFVKCQDCGENNNTKNNYCTKCGEKLIK